MVDKKITQLTNITGANLADADEFVVVDTSEDETKAITRAEFFKDTPQIGVGTSSPSYPLHVNGTIFSVGTNNLPALAVSGNSTTEGDIAVLDGENLILGHHTLDGNTGGLTERFRIDSSGDIIVNYTGLDMDFRVESDSQTHMFFLDAGDNAIGINNSAPKGMVHVVNTGNKPNFLSTGASGSDLDYAVPHDEIMQFGGFNVTSGAVDVLRMSLEINGNVTIEDGDLVVANGHGIDFSATSGTGTSELFDDYEEGEWTPTAATSSGNAASFGSVSGIYTKIGRTVFVKGFIGNIDTSGTTSSSQLRVTGLPFTVDAQDAYGVCYTDDITFQGGRTYIASHLETSEYVIFMQGGSSLADTATDHGDVDSSDSDIFFSAFYQSSQ